MIMKSQQQRYIEQMFFTDRRSSGIVLLCGILCVLAVAHAVVVHTNCTITPAQWFVYQQQHQ